ncbi:uncharacterized protein LOC118646618 [Monomorium pharaonis]|uniref:uncharacterized protein LOC118646618 n=1 Tax=Monomorium pharaonis TaxID=307658 RepID=UPI001746349B|nr:uncharacterized protein LOC118646618 [Monomorium pharaonis]
MTDRDPHQWIQKLTEEQARQHLTDRGLDIRGILPVLRARLARYEEAILRGATPSGTPDPVEAISDPFEGLGAAEPGPSIPSFTIGDFGVGNRVVRSPPAENSTAKGEHGGMGARKREYEYTFPPRADPVPSHTGRRSPRSSAADAYNLMRKWNLHFSGSKNCDAEAFLTRIKEARSILPVTDADLFKCLPIFMSDAALYWVRLESENWRNWQDFETAWRVRFGDPDYQYALREEVMRRTQGEQESAADYLTRLRTLLAKMTPPWSLQEQLNFAYRNLLPRLRLVVQRHDFTCFRSMEELVTRMERNYAAEKCYRPPLPPEQSLFPELAYHAPKGKAKSPGTVAAISTTNSGASRGRTRAPRASAEIAAGSSTSNPLTTPSGTISAAAASNDVKCWNCEKIGHRARDCTEPRRTHCYRCGKRGYTVRTCPSCSGNASGSQ